MNGTITVVDRGQVHVHSHTASEDDPDATTPGSLPGRGPPRRPRARHAGDHRGDRRRGRQVRPAHRRPDPARPHDPDRGDHSRHRDHLRHPLRVREGHGRPTTSTPAANRWATTAAPTRRPSPSVTPSTRAQQSSTSPSPLSDHLNHTRSRRPDSQRMIPEGPFSVRAFSGQSRALDGAAVTERQRRPPLSNAGTLNIRDHRSATPSNTRRPATGSTKTHHHSRRPVRPAPDRIHRGRRSTASG